MNETVYVILTGTSHGSALGPSEVYGTLRNEAAAKNVASGFDYWEWKKDGYSSDRTINNSYALVFESEVDASREEGDDRVDEIRTHADIKEELGTNFVDVHESIDIECHCGEMITVTSEESTRCKECEELWVIE